MAVSGTGRLGIGKGLGDLSAPTLRFYRQIGVEEVGLPGRFVTEPAASRPHVPPPQNGPPGPQRAPWDPDELRRACERVCQFDLLPSSLGLSVSGNILLGRPGREADVAQACEAIRVAGAAGVRTMTYTFSALRASAGYYARAGEGRGGADLRAFDAARGRDLPPIESVGRHTKGEMWERLTRFLEDVVPVAEAAGVRLALHPNDPPVPEFRGVGQAVTTLEDMKRLVAVVDSPANTLFLDTGVLTEIGESAPQAILYFGRRDRIGAVHFRNVRVDVPIYRYLETFLDEGDCDMAACMRAFHEAGYTGWVDPDHTPGISGDTVDTHIGWAFAIGQIIALRGAVEREPRR